jgi:hypothetical protein
VFGKQAESCAQFLRKGSITGGPHSNAVIRKGRRQDLPHRHRRRETAVRPAPGAINGPVKDVGPTSGRRRSVRQRETQEAQGQSLIFPFSYERTGAGA